MLTPVSIQSKQIQTSQLDTLRTVETPEGINLELRVAGPVARTLAWLIDFLIRLAVWGLALGGLLNLGSTGLGLSLLLAFLLEWFYPVVFEVYFDGATPGKRALGLKVCSDNGAPVDWPASLIRNLLRAADFLPFFYGFGLLSMMFNRDFKRLGDLAAATVVIYRDSDRHEVQLPAGPAQAPYQSLDPVAQSLLINFAERSTTLNPQRQEELAALLVIMTKPNAGSSSEQLLAQARWLLGSHS